MHNNVILIIAAHPDDEVLGCGGLIAKKSELGYIIHVLFISNGVGSRNIRFGKEVGIRKKSAKDASKILGIHSIAFLDYPDNRMDSIPLLDIVKDIEKVVMKLQPDVVYTHHIGDLNIAHHITHKATITACRPQPNFCVKEIYAFEIPSSTEYQTPGYLMFNPNVYFDISSKIEIKRMALEAYGGEMNSPPHSRSIKNILNLNTLRGSSVGIDSAEAFVLIRSIRDQ